jgi:hypothetical protein
MDNIMIIRVVGAVLIVVILFVLIQRRRNKAK